jgi:flagellar basal-body rod protein FlgF
MSSLYTSMAGLQAITARMEATSSNLANVQTPGYAAVQAVTEAAPYAGANAPGGADAVALAPGPDTTQGALTHTGDPFNVGLSGNAWLQVQTPNGSTALTRDGSLELSAAGILTDTAGDPVLNAGGAPISLPSLAKLEIGADGTISGVPASSPGGPAQSFGQLGMVATPAGGLTDLGNSLFAPATGAPLTPATGAKLEQGYLNGSNVDPTQAMMELIQDSRSYQLQTQMMKTQTGGGADLNTLLAQG